MITTSSSLVSLTSVEALGAVLPPMATTTASAMITSSASTRLFGADTSLAPAPITSGEPVSAKYGIFESIPTPESCILNPGKSKGSYRNPVESTFSLRHQLQVLDEGDDLLPSARPAIVGHRGALYDELENTREGFLRCANAGCDGIELDVFLLKDGELIVFHGGGTDEDPGDLSDYCVDMEGVNILDLTYPEALALQFNPYFEEFPCSASKIAVASIPTLRQVLEDLRPTSCNVKIELKGPGTPEPCLKLVEELGMLTQVQFSSFDHGRLRQLRELRPQRDSLGRYLVRTGALFNEVPSDFLERVEECGASEVHLRYDTCTSERVRAIHEKGLGSMAWMRGPQGMRKDTSTKYLDVGNEDSECYRALFATGVQQLCCNRPLAALALIDSDRSCQNMAK